MSEKEKPEPTSLGRLVHELRLARKLTLADLAERSGLTIEAISGIERGTRRDPSWSTVRALAAGLGVPIGALGEAQAKFRDC